MPVKKNALWKAFLALAAVCCVLLCASGALAQEEVTLVSTELFDGRRPYSGKITEPSFNYDIEAFNAYMTEKMFDFNSKIDVSAFRLSYNDAYWAYAFLRYMEADLTHVDGSVYIHESNGIVTHLGPIYVYSAQEHEESRELIRSGVSEIVDYAREADTDLGRILRANDYICLHYEYDYALEMRKADEVIRSRKCVCQGYTTLYRAVLEELDIPNTIAYSQDMNHIWNAVWVDGSWYHIDVTWNDPSRDETAVPQYVRHTDFMLSDDGIAASGHYGWVSPFVADDARYDDFFWTDLEQAASMLGDVVYYAKNDASIENRVIYAWDLAKGQESTVHSYYYGYTSFPSHVCVTEDVLYYTVGASLCAVPIKGGTAQVVFKTTASGTYLWNPYLDGGDLMLYAASWCSSLGGEVLRFGISPEIRALEPEAQVYGFGFRPDVVHVKTGGAVRLRASLYPQPSAEYIITWSSADPSVATVDANGRVTGKKAGVTQIMASYGEWSASCALAVSGEGALTLPSSTVSIGAEAFRGMTARCVQLPDGVKTLGERAFADSQIDMICLPDGLESIGEDAFVNNESVILVAGADTVGAVFARKNGLTWVTPE